MTSNREVNNRARAVSLIHMICSTSEDQYILWYTREVQGGEVVNAIDLYIYDRTLHEWIHRRDVGYPQLILQVCRYDRLYVNQTLCLYMTTTLFINSPYHTRWCYNINDDSNLVDWILIDRWRIWVWPRDFVNSIDWYIQVVCLCSSQELTT